MQYIKNRLSERMTWAGISAALVSTAGAVAIFTNVPVGVVKWLAGGIAFCGVVAALLPAPKQ